MAHCDLLLTGGIVVTPNGRQSIDSGVVNGRISAPGDLHARTAETAIDCRGLDVLPCIIDAQVHFREPGAEHKEDLSTGTAAAVAGRVTPVFEVPNAGPLAVAQVAIDEKIARASGRAWGDHAVFVGEADKLIGLPTGEPVRFTETLQATR